MNTEQAEVGDFEMVTCPECGWVTDAYECMKAYKSRVN